MIVNSCLRNYSSWKTHKWYLLTRLSPKVEIIGSIPFPLNKVGGFSSRSNEKMSVSLSLILLMNWTGPRESTSYPSGLSLVTDGLMFGNEKEEGLWRRHRQTFRTSQQTTCAHTVCVWVLSEPWTETKLSESPFRDIHEFQETVGVRYWTRRASFVELS